MVRLQLGLRGPRNAGTGKATSESRRAMNASGLLVASGLLAGLGNLLFNLVVARSAGPSTYGAVGSLLMLVTVAGFFTVGARYAVAHVTAVEESDVRALRRAFAGVAPWLVVSLLLAAVAIPLSAYLRLASPIPVLLVGLLLVGTVLSAAPGGILIGRSRFRAVAFIGISATVARVLLGLALKRYSGTVDGALLESILPIFAALAIRIVWVVRTGQAHGTGAPPAASSAPGKSSGLAARGAVGTVLSGGIWGIWALPLLAARHRLDLHQAGEFAVAQLLAGSIIWATAPVVTAFYPALARSRDRHAGWVGLAATAVVAAAGTLGLALLGPWLIPHLYGKGFQIGRPLLAILGSSAAITATLSFLCWSLIARRRIAWALTPGVLSGVLAALLLCGLWASTPLELASCPALALGVGTVLGWGAQLAHQRWAGRTAARPSGAETVSLR